MKTLNIQEKIQKVLAKTESKESEPKTKALNIGLKTKESEPKTKALNIGLKKKGKTFQELKKAKSQLQESTELTTEKFYQVEKLYKKIESMENSFNTFLNNMNDSIAVMNNFNNKLDTLESLELNSIKNQKQILDKQESTLKACNSFHAILMNQESKAFYSNDTKTESKESEPKTKTILRKGKAKNKESESIEMDMENLSINDIYSIFQGFFGNKSFMKSTVLDENSLPIFMDIMNTIDISNMDTLNKSLQDIISKYRKEKIYFIAPKSTNDFKQAIIQTIEKIDSDFNSNDENSESNSIPINKEYFAKKFNTDITIIQDIIDDCKKFDEMESELIESIESFIKESLEYNINENELGIFINFIKMFMNTNN